MAQIKRLTRKQKVLLSRIQTGNQPPAATDPRDLSMLEAHGKIELTRKGWVAAKEDAQ